MPRKAEAGYPKKNRSRPHNLKMSNYLEPPAAPPTPLPSILSNSTNKDIKQKGKSSHVQANKNGILVRHQYLKTSDPNLYNQPTKKEVKRQPIRKTQSPFPKNKTFNDNPDIQNKDALNMSIEEVNTIIHSNANQEASGAESNDNQNNEQMEVLESTGKRGLQTPISNSTQNAANKRHLSNSLIRELKDDFKFLDNGKSEIRNEKNKNNKMLCRNPNI